MVFPLTESAPRYSLATANAYFNKPSNPANLVAPVGTIGYTHLDLVTRPTNGVCYAYGGQATNSNRPFFMGSVSADTDYGLTGHDVPVIRTQNSLALAGDALAYPQGASGYTGFSSSLANGSGAYSRTRCYFRIDDSGSSYVKSTTGWARLFGVKPYYDLAIYVNTSGQLQGQYYTTVSGTSSSSLLPTGSWFRLEVYKSAGGYDVEAFFGANLEGAVPDWASTVPTGPATEYGFGSPGHNISGQYIYQADFGFQFGTASEIQALGRMGSTIASSGPALPQGVGISTA